MAQLNREPAQVDPQAFVLKRAQDDLHFALLNAGSALDRIAQVRGLNAAETVLRHYTNLYLTAKGE